MSGRALTNMPLIRNDGAAGTIVFIRHPDCPPPCRFPHHVSGDEIEKTNSRARMVCCSPEDEAQF